jgi:hypothetical protein
VDRVGEEGDAAAGNDDGDLEKGSGAEDDERDLHGTDAPVAALEDAIGCYRVSVAVEGV